MEVGDLREYQATQCRTELKTRCLGLPGKCEQWRGLCAGGIERAGFGCECVGGVHVCVISSLVGTLGLAAPSPASMQDMERCWAGQGEQGKS